MKFHMSRMVKLGLVFLALFMMCVGPMLSDMYSYNRTHVSVKPENVRYASVKNTVVSQVIYLEGYISNLGIAFYAPSGQLYGDATVTITVTQGKKSISETVKAAKLRVLCGYEVDQETHLEENSRYEMTYMMRAGLFRLNSGEAVVSVYSPNLPEGTDLFCEVSSTVTGGLPSAMAGENILGSPMVLEYDVFYIDGHFWYESALLVLLLILLGFAAWLLTWASGRKHYYALLYWTSFAIIIITVSIRNPYASFYGEPRSEAAYEFWYKAENLGFFQNLFSLMSGEAPAVFERLLMWVANTFSPRKYVFVTAQLLELSWISMVASLSCLPCFRKYFRDEIRLMVGVFLGTSLLFDSAYFFWSCSYWALLFLLFFALLPLERLTRSVYIAGLFLTAVLCMSRIYHILLIPVAITAALVLGKRRGKRYILYCGTVACFSLLEGILAFGAKTNLAAGSNPLENIADIGVFRILGNTLYYHLQTINSFFTGAAHWQGSGVNILSCMLFLSILVTFLWCIKNKRVEMSIWIGTLGFLSLGTIAINVYVSGSAVNVSFPINYASPVEWGRNYYQNADLHFSYAYVCLVFLLLTSIYMGKTAVAHVAELKIKSNWKAIAHQIELSEAVCIALLLCLSASVNMKARLGYYNTGIVVEWDSIYQVTENDTYFAAINTFYGAAPISLEQGTDEMVYGVDESGVLYEWHEGLDRYTHDKAYRSAEIGAVSASEKRPILSVTAKRALKNFTVQYVAVLYDREGNELARATQVQKERRLWLDFLFDEPVIGVYKIEFELIDGNPAFIQDGLQVGYVLTEEQKENVK